MSLPSTVLVKVGAAAAILAVLALLCVVVPWMGIKDGRQDVQLANGFQLIFATENEVKKVHPDAFTLAKSDGYHIYRGWFYAKSRTAIIYTTHPERFTQALFSRLPILLESACKGTFNAADTAGLNADEKDAVGTIFHELIGHGSDAFQDGHLFTTMQMYWPDIHVPDPEPVQNPWDIVRHYWPADATHPELETKH